MARKVKCHYTKEEGKSDVFFLADNGKYYKDEATYNEWCTQMEYYHAIVDIFSDILGYNDSGQFNSQAMKELSMLNKTYQYLDILDTFKEYHVMLKAVIESKSDMSDYIKAKYVFAAIKNKINDVMDSNKQREKAEKAIQESNIDLDIMNSDTNIVNNKKRDISDFLDY